MTERDKTQDNRSIQVVVFTDMEGFTRLTEEDEQKALDAVDRYRAAVRKVTADWQGELIHFYGDGSLMIFRSAVNAVQCAVALQSALKDIPVRIGIHLGEVVRSNDTVYGNAVNTASRLQALGRPQSVLVSGAVARELENHEDVSVAFIGSEKVKNLSKPLDVYGIASEGLMVPTIQEIKRQNPSGKSPRLVIGLLLLLVLGGVVIDNFQKIFPGKYQLRNKRLLVLPFENETGDTLLDQASFSFAAYITHLLQDVEEVRIVSMREVVQDSRISSFGILPYSTLTRLTQADIFVEGSFYAQDEDILRLNFGLVDGETGEYIQQFREVSLSRSEPYTDLVKVSERLTGFIASEEHEPLTIPTGKAFEAYLEALRRWGENNYKDAQELLHKALEYDSTFLDAFLALSDAYYSGNNLVRADSVLNVVRSKFAFESLNERQQNALLFYEDFYAGVYDEAYEHLWDHHKKDQRELFGNTSLAAFALYYLNDASRAISILRRISYPSLDFSLHENRSRIYMGIQGYFATGKYPRARKLADFFPSGNIDLREHKMRIRSFTGVQDTSSINEELDLIANHATANDFLEALWWTYSNFKLLGLGDYMRIYLQRCRNYVREHDVISRIRAEILLEVGDEDAALEHARLLYDYAPDWPRYMELLGRCYAVAERKDSTLAMLARIDALPNRPGLVFNPDYLQARIFCAAGELERAISSLNDAISTGMIFYEDAGYFDPVLMPLFTLPEFQHLMQPE